MRLAPNSPAREPDLAVAHKRRVHSRNALRVVGVALLASGVACVHRIPGALIAPSHDGTGRADDPATWLTPAPTRAPLRVESAGDEQTVGVLLGPPPALFSPRAGRDRLDVCVTPCTLYVPPGTVSLVAYADGLMPNMADLDSLASGAVVRAHAGTQLGFDGGGALTAVGAGVMVIGIALMAGATRGFQDAASFNALLPGISFGLVGLGAAVLGGVVTWINSPGIDVRDPGGSAQASATNAAGHRAAL